MKQFYRLYGIPLWRIRIPIFSVLSFLLLLTATSQAQQVNSYAKVNSITNSATRTTLNILNRSQVASYPFAVGEQVLVIQMQGNIIGTNTGDNVNFGNLAAAGISNVGFYDVATIYSLTGSTAITLTDLLPNKFTFGTDNNVQVVSFKNLGDYSTTATVTAPQWNGATGVGGVVAIQANTLTINHNITVDGLGFVGGAKSANSQDGTCGSATFITSSTNYGAKGEGIYLVNTTTNPSYARGRGKILSGGGGGSQGNAGGGGGSNFSAGGTGGPGWSCTGSNSAGGLGGIDLSSTMLVGTRVFMGGGGGGGQGNDGESTAGANGGGIIIISAKTVTTGCSGSVRISANGNSSSNATGSGADGVGGAGAAGTILMHVSNFTVPAGCPLNIQANGGNGGNVTNNDTHGGGGGGGRGAIIFAHSQPTTNVNSSTSPGTGGRNNAAGTTSAGGGGSTAGSIIVDVGAVLPVQLKHFGVENINKNAVLNWTATDDANISYTILHATDGVNFTPIGSVDGKGNTTNNYSFTDANTTPGKNYYQLQMSGDVTTRISYSGVVWVNMNEEKSLAVAWPNPAHDQFSVRVNNEYANKMHQVVITDLTGKLMYTNAYKPAGGIIKITPARVLKPGMYIFKLTSEGYEQSGKLFIK